MKIGVESEEIKINANGNVIKIRSSSLWWIFYRFNEDLRWTVERENICVVDETLFS